MRSLALRVSFREEEPSYGLLARLAVRHRRKDLSTFAGDVGLSYRDVVGGGGISAIATLAGFEPERVTWWTPAPDWHARHFRGEKFHNNDWFVHDERRVCVGCLRDDLHVHAEAADSGTCCNRRFWWDLRAVDVCPRHSAWLIDRCPSCNRSLTLQAADVRFCPCGADLAAADPEVVDPLEARADAYILGRILEVPHRAVPVLDGLPLGHATALMFALGWQVQGGRIRAGSSRAELTVPESLPSTPPGTLWKRGASREAKLSAKMESFRILRRWPRAYHRFLDDLFRRAKDHLGSAARRDDGSSRAYRLFGHRLAGWDFPGIQPLRDEYERHFLANVPAGPKTVVFGRPAMASRWVTLSVANEACGLKPWATELYPILCDLGIVGPDKVKHTRVRIARSRLQEIAEAYGDALNQIEAARLLGISQSGVMTLRAAGILTTRDNAHDKSSHRYSRIEIEYLLYDIAGSTPRLGEEDVGGLIDVAAAAQMTDGHGFMGFERLMRALATRTLLAKAVREQGCGLAAILLDRADVERLMDRRRSPQAQTLAQLGQSLCIGPKALRFMIEEGLLPVTKLGANKARASSYDVAKFRRNYVTAGEIARDIGVHHITICHALRRRGYKPAFDVARAGGYIFKRTEALRSFLKKARPSGSAEDDK